MLQTADGLNTHISNLQDMFDISETAGFPVDEIEKVDLFRESVSGHPIIVKALETFDFEFPDSTLTTYEQVTAYLVLHLPNLRHAQLAATRAAANLVAATAYTTLEAESKRLQAEMEKLKRQRPRGTKNSKNKNKKQQRKKQMGKGNDPAESPSTELKYCYGHGYQKSHNSADCKLLAGDKKKFTAEMRRATGPNHPPGGSTKINGQTAPQKPKTVTANMVHQLEPTSNDDSFDEQSDDGLDETEAFLSGILEDYKTEEATAMMMDDALLLDDMTPR